MESGELERSDSVLSEAVERGRAAGEALAAADAAVARSYLRAHTVPEWSDEQVAQELQGVIHVFEELGDEAGLARALSLAGMLRYWRGEAAAAIADLEQPPATHAAWATGHRRRKASSACSWPPSGSDHVRDALARVEEIRGRAETNRGLEISSRRATWSRQRSPRAVLTESQIEVLGPRPTPPPTALLCERTSVAFSNATTRS